jgi:hypothetical protein
MTLTADGWLDWASRDPGPPAKTYSAWNTLEFYVAHSAVGFFPAWRSRLFSNERRPDGAFTAYAAASVHGWIDYDGRVVQHYPLTASCWASGSREANTRSVAFETEGGAPGNVNEPLTIAQLTSHVRLLKDVAAWKGVGLEYWRRPVSEWDVKATLYEHNECGRFGSTPTACPSDRFPWDVIEVALGVTPCADAELSPPVFVQEPGEGFIRRYLWTGKRLHYMRTATMREEMARFLGISPAPQLVGEATWRRIGGIGNEG